MRDDSIRVLSWLLLAAVSGSAHAQPPSLPLRVQLAAEQQLRAGSAASVEVIVELSAGDDSPLLLTPTVEGSAAEVVRGRLSRSDGKLLDPTHLRFEIPLLARSEGTAILRVEIMTYVCERRCRQVLIRRSQVLRVSG